MFNYKVIIPNPSHDQTEAALNELASQGFRVVTAVSFQGVRTDAIILEREVTTAKAPAKKAE